MKKLLFIVNGEDVGVQIVEVQISAFRTMRVAKVAALSSSKNTALPTTKWQICDESNRIVDETLQVDAFPEGTRFLLILPVAAGG